MKISSIYPVYVKKYGVGYACQSILDGMISAGAEVNLFCVTCDSGDVKSYYRLSMHPSVKSLGYKLLGSSLITKFTEWRFLRQVRAGDVVHVWPGTSIDLFEKLKQQKCIAVLENINTHQATSKAILDAELKRLGLTDEYGISQQSIDAENAKLGAVDYVFCPSNEVLKSLRSEGIPDHKIIMTSYGLDASDLLDCAEIPARRDKPGLPVALFVGRIGIRKGAHLLMEYWTKAGVQGVLKLVGNIEPDARHLIEPYLDHPAIEHIPFTTDLKTLYKQSDVFIFPSLEEGSPLVTYLALGAGLPVIVSPMGGGGIVEHGREGVVIDPHDSDAWVEAIRSVFSDESLRARYSENARAKAPEYLWQNVGRKRYHELMARLQESSGLSRQSK